MRFERTPLEGAFVIHPEKIGDERGFFSRLFCSKEFQTHGLDSSFPQVNNSMNGAKGTLRGMHYQLSPKQETKVVRCISGSLFDVILDIREKSPTFGQWFGTTLTEENRQMMVVPKGFAHGFITLKSNTELIYFVSEFYDKELERGILWNDPMFSIKWPITPTVVSDRDQNHPHFDAEYHLNLQTL